MTVPATLGAKARAARAVGTVFGLGRLRPAPGTWASAATVIAVYALTWAAGPWPIVALAAAATLAGIWAARNVLSFSASADPAEVVIDEVVGQSVALLPVVFGAAGAVARGGVQLYDLWPGWVAAFLLFRLFDIWKPSLIGRADRDGGPLGLMADDLLAGSLSALLVMAMAGLYHGAMGL